MSNLLPKEPPRDNPYLIPCKLCGIPTAMLGTKRCHPCWQLEQGIAARPVQARQLLGVKKTGGCKGDVMEGRDWHVGLRSNHEVTIQEGDTLVGRVDVCFADMIINDHNQHAQLVEQRGRLARALKELRGVVYQRTWGHVEAIGEGCGCKTCVVKRADDALATVEQGGNS